MEDQVILLRRRGVNYYTDYAEKYLEQAFSEQGLHLTLRRENAEQVCSLQYDRKPDLIFRSPLLQTLTLQQTEEIVRRLGEAFNTVAATAPASLYPLPENGEGVIEYGLTRGPGAFDEAPYLTAGEPLIGWRAYPSVCLRDGCRRTVTVQNYGGISRGLSVCLTMPASYTCLDLCVEVQDWRRFRNRYMPVDIFISRAEADVQLSGDMQILRWDFPAVEIPEGVNLFSRKLLGPHKAEMDHARQVLVAFVLDGPDEVFRDVALTVTALGGNTVELQFENELPLWAQQPDIQFATTYAPQAYGQTVMPQTDVYAPTTAPQAYDDGAFAAYPETAMPESDPAPAQE